MLTSDGSGLTDIDIAETPQGNAALLALQGITEQEALAALTLARQSFQTDNFESHPAIGYRIPLITEFAKMG